MSGLRSGFSGRPLDISKESFQYIDRNPYGIRSAIVLVNHHLDQVSRLFPQAHAPRSTGVAVEHELLTVDAATGGTVDPERVRAAVADLPFAPYVGFEPGGQVELSLSVRSDSVSAAELVVETVAGLRSACLAAGIHLDAQPVDPRPESRVPLRLRSARYVAMQRHFDTIGPAGRRMMRRTASTQVCLDWWGGDAGVEQWRVLNLAGPFLAATFARGTGPRSRLATWLQVDPARTAFDGRLLRGDDPVAAYSAFAAGATVFVNDPDPAVHLTTLFPPVRPRGRYLEVRFPDVQEEASVAGLAGVLSALAHDDAIRTTALQLLAPEEAHLGGRWREAALGLGSAAGRGRELVELSGAVTVREGAA